MLVDWIRVSKISIGNAEQLYPDGIEWTIQPGVNAVIGGTGLGKTTLLYALQFAIFDKLIINTAERVEREFFKGRLTTRSVESIKEAPPYAAADFSVGKSLFSVRRNLLTGAILEATCDDSKISGAKYLQLVASKTGLDSDIDALAQLQSRLFFFGENRSLLAWDNRLQNEILNLVFSDKATYQKLDKLWASAESADSEARNLSAQAVRLEHDLKQISGDSGLRELERRGALQELNNDRDAAEKNLLTLRKRIVSEQSRFGEVAKRTQIAQEAFQRELDKLEEKSNAGEQDDFLVSLAASPTAGSVRYALEQFYREPKSRLCPCCGRTGISHVLSQLAAAALAGAEAGACIVCSKDLSLPDRPSRNFDTKSTDNSAIKLQEVLLEREKLRSRVDHLREEEASAIERLAHTREREVKFLRENPEGAEAPFRAAIALLRNRQQLAIGKREKAVQSLRKELETTNVNFERIQTQITSAFTRYASLYLDEPCDVQFLQEEDLPSRKGPQIKAPHAAFFPVISGQTRPSAQALSDAQRSFVDLAFRMAVIEVWQKKTKHNVTLIVETPEGAVDIAYMERVATMLREFAAKGHTLLVTTNLNNDIFLPEVLAKQPKRERIDRILNLLTKGRPRPVQLKNMPQFEKILAAVKTHKVVT